MLVTLITWDLLATKERKKYNALEYFKMAEEAEIKRKWNMEIKEIGEDKIQEEKRI